MPRLYESLYKSIIGSFKQARGLKATIIHAATWVTRVLAEARAVKAGLVLRDTPPSVAEKVCIFKTCYLHRGVAICFVVFCVNYNCMLRCTFIS